MYELTVFHFMSDKLNLYSDIGNIIALKQRAKKRNINLKVIEINETEGVTLEKCDIFFIGGGSDREQSIATKELSKIKTILKDAIEDGMPGLTICGGYQFKSDTFGTIVGFENHGGRTYHNFNTLGHVVTGYGNNDDDKKEGIHYKNLLGTYLHGPILPKNHELTDYLLEKACERKGIPFTPKQLDNTEEEAAKYVIIERSEKE